MREVFDTSLPRIAYVFGDMTGGGHNLQAYKTIIYSGALKNCVAISLSCSTDNSLEKKLNDIGIQVKYCLVNRSNYFRGITQLRKLVNESDALIVHSNGLRADLACYLAFKNTNINHVITLHNYLKEDALLRMNKLKAKIAVEIQRQVLKKAKYIIACSKTLREQMCNDIPGVLVTAIQNGVDIDNFPKMDMVELRKQYKYPQEEIIFISTGSMTRRKRINETIEAFISANLPQSRLLLVGEGILFKEYIERYQSYGNIEFLGRRNDIKELLNIADIFVSSSESEGLPLAVLEAISVGKRVYLSDIPQHLEIINTLDWGCVYPLGNNQELCSLIKQTQRDAEVRIDIKGTDFDIDIMGKKYFDYYMEMGTNNERE